MSNEIYKILNSVKTDMSKYEAESVNDIERKRWKKRALNNVRHKKGRKHWKAGAAVCAAAVIMLIGMNMGNFNHIVQAAVKVISYEISKYLGIKDDLEPYKTVVGKSVYHAGVTITLNEIVIDEDGMYVLSTQSYDEKKGIDHNKMIFESVYINGRIVSVGSSGSSREEDDHTILSMMYCEIPDIDINQTLDFEIEFVDFNHDSDTWNFKFSSSGKELTDSSNITELDQTFKLPDGEEIHLYKYKDNAMGQKIYFSTSGAKYTYDIMLSGVDNCGKPVEFTTSMWNDGNGRMEVSTIDNGYISDDAEELYLTLYAMKIPEKSGKMDSDYEKIGDQFCIKIK